MKSCIYAGTVLHQRFFPIQHRFRYSLHMMYLDLSELETVFQDRWFWSTTRLAIARFRREDHFGDPQIPLDCAVRDLIESEGNPRPNGPIRLMTHLRYFGFVINPVSFYYCFDKEDNRVVTIVAEVTNTPWGEQHCYILRPQSNGTHLIAENRKTFHVSPFMGMDQSYSWVLSQPGERNSLVIKSYEQSRQLFEASLLLELRPINTSQLARVLVWHPLMTLKVLFAIYWQAVRLWWKRCPYYPHPKQTENRK